MEDKININEVVKTLKVEDPEAFRNYLKEVWTDLYARVTENKNDPKEKQVKATGVTKLIFSQYYELPGIIGDRLFNVFDADADGVLLTKEFLAGMETLFCEDFDKTVKFIFDFYDFDHDGKINKEDIRVVISYITLVDSPDIKSTGINLSYKSRVNSQEELHNILQTCFEKIPGNKMNFENFKNVIENVNSDIYLLIYLFLLENKPFSLEILKTYEKKARDKKAKDKDKDKGKDKEKDKDKNHPKSPAEKLIASPTKTSSFSPYKCFNKKYKQRKSVVLNPGAFNLVLNTMDENNEDEKKERTKKKKKTIEDKAKQQLEKFAEKEKEKGKDKKLDEKRIKDLTKKKRDKDKKCEDADAEIKPAFKMKKKKADDKKESAKGKKGGDIEFNEDKYNFDVESGEEKESRSSNSDDDSDDDDDDEDDSMLKYEGYLYKFVEDKMKKLWFKLIHKDLYYYKNKDDKVHKGMHNLSGLFYKEEKEKIFNDKTYYSFSIVYPNRNRLYFCDDLKEYKNWVEKLKQATGFTDLLNLYEVKQKLGNGKFGLVKLGINKETGQKVAIKIMNKNNMDSLDLELVRTEINILKICQHPNIIRLYDILENVDYIYIVMEYCSGGDFFSYLEKRKFKLNEEKASSIMHKLCTAVFYIHSYGIAHRDLKPENILMTSPDDDGDIRILDFGLSKILGPDETCTEPYGTLTYCAPEIIVDEPYSKAVDLWSLGIMTYLMLCSKLPFNDKDETEIARKVAFDEPDFDRTTVWKNISKEAMDFTKRLLEKDPKKRMTIEQALEHEWIKKYSKANVTEIRRSSISKQNKFEMYTSLNI